MFDFHEKFQDRHTKLMDIGTNVQTKLYAHGELKHEFVLRNEDLSKIGLENVVYPDDFDTPVTLHEPYKTKAVIQAPYSGDVRDKIAELLGVKDKRQVFVTKEIGDNYNVEVKHSDIVSKRDVAKIKNFENTIEYDLSLLPEVRAKVAKMAEHGPVLNAVVEIKPSIKFPLKLKLSPWLFGKDAIGNFKLPRDLLSVKVVPFSKLSRRIESILESEKERKKVGRYLKKQGIEYYTFRGGD